MASDKGSDDEKARAEARLLAAATKARAADEAMAQHRAERAALHARTTKLKELRLAKEALDKEAAAGRTARLRALRVANEAGGRETAAARSTRGVASKPTQIAALDAAKTLAAATDRHPTMQAARVVDAVKGREVVSYPVPARS